MKTPGSLGPPAPELLRALRSRQLALLATAVLTLSGLLHACSEGPDEAPAREPPPTANGTAEEPTLPPRPHPEPYGPIADRPSVWLLTIDTLRADHLGCYGYARDTTPFLDTLAERSVRFDQALVQWPKTGPSIASILSGTYGSTSGVMRTTAQDPVPEVFALLPEILQIEGGYECMGVVTNVSLTPKFNYHQGFDRFELKLGGTNAEARSVYAKAREMMQERKKAGAPFFLWTHLIDPHSPYQTPDRYREMFVGDAVYEQDQRPPAPLDPNIEKVPGRGPGPQQDVGCIGRRAYLKEFGGSVRDYVVEYDAEIRYGDDQLRDFVQWMRQQGHLENTLIVYTADHGESLGDHDYYFAHGRFPYDACTRVPLLIHHPRIPPGIVEEPVALLDLAPTILDAVGLEPGYQMEGSSILRWLMEPELEREVGPVFTESGYGDEYTVALRRGRYKLIKVNDQHLRAQLRGEPYELYDVREDPAETVDLVHARPEVFSRMKAELDLYQQVAYARVPPAQGRSGDLSELEKALLSELGYNESGKMGEDDARPNETEEEGGRPERRP